MFFLFAVDKKSFSILYILVVLIGFLLIKRRPIELRYSIHAFYVCDSLASLCGEFGKVTEGCRNEFLFSVDLKNKKAGKGRSQNST